MHREISIHEAQAMLLQAQIDDHIRIIQSLLALPSGPKWMQAAKPRRLPPQAQEKEKRAWPELISAIDHDQMVFLQGMVTVEAEFIQTTHACPSEVILVNDQHGLSFLTSSTPLGHPSRKCFARKVYQAI